MLDIHGFDTETWSSNKISLGLEHYFSDPDFEIICAGFANEYISGCSEDGAMHPTGSGIWVAHNMPFDRWAVETMYGKKKAKAVIWFDSMIAVRALLGASMGRNSYISLDKATKLLLPAEFHKDEKGAELMPYFSFPSPQNHFGKISWRNMKIKHPELWKDYLHYCEQDTIGCRELAVLCREYLGVEAFERLVFEAELTYRMNKTGWPVDKKLLQAMTGRAQENTEGSLDKLIEEFNPGWSTVKKNGDE